MLVPLRQKRLRNNRLQLSGSAAAAIIIEPVIGIMHTLG